MKIKKIAICAAALFCVGCAGAAETPPTLVATKYVANDIAVVTRGDVDNFVQYKSVIRVQSEGLYFGETSLSFSEFTCVNGQQVKAGEVLARLDTESLAENIQHQREALTKLEADHALENEKAEIDIAIARLELQQLMTAASDVAGVDEKLRESIDMKKLAIQRLEIQLAQTIERQALSVSQAREALAEMESEMSEAVLRSPIDGVVVDMEAKGKGSAVEAYRPIIYVSDEKTLFAEYSNFTGSDMVPRTPDIVGVYNGKVYALERMTFSRADFLYYGGNMDSGPNRFTILDYDESMQPGDFIYLYVYSNMAKDVLRIPVNALYTDAEMGDYVYKIVNGQKVSQSVTVGVASAAYVEIVEGLQEGDEVFVKQ